MPSINSGTIFGDAYNGYGVGQGAILGGVPIEGAIGAGRFGNANSLALGNIDAQAFLQQQPEFQEGFQNEIAKGGDPNKWLELAINNASYIDPASVPRGGGVAGSLQALTGSASGMETGANTALRGSNLSDLRAFGGGMADAYRAANPGLFNSLQTATGLLGQGGFTPMSAQGYEAATYSPMASLTADQLQQGRLGGSLYNQALNAGPTSASNALLGRANTLAQSTGQLTPLEYRNIQQGTREAFAARGMEMSNGAIAAEIGNRIGAERSRQTEDLSLAAMLGNAYQQDRNASQGFATGVYGQELGRQGQNQGANLTAGLANQGAYNQAGQFNAQATNAARQYSADAANKMALANSQLAMQQQGQNQGYALNLVGAQQNAAYDPTRLLGATSGAPGMAGSILGYGTAYNPDTSGLYNNAVGVAQDVNMTRYNAEMAAKAAAANNKAGLIKGGLALAGQVLGGPIGGMIGTGIGNMFGGGGNPAASAGSLKGYDYSNGYGAGYTLGG